ncbi:MAG TPA: hypothetical protein VMW72_01225 [Sedimentisphaerales bacterium]|nr:hypothetical protein [Sedimentisphaerales bacterium]
MVEWFKNLSEGWQTAIFGAGVAVALAVIGGLFALFKWLFGKKDGPPPQEKTIDQKGSGNKAAVIDGSGNTANIAGRDIHTGINEDVLNAALKALNAVLSMVDTDQSKNLVSELKKISDEKLSTPIELVQDKHNNQQKLQLEKEFQLYGELWKALVDVRSSIIITPTLDRMPKGKSPYDVYKDRYDVAVDAFNKAKNLLENNRPWLRKKLSVNFFILHRRFSRSLLCSCSDIVFQ